MGIASTDRHTLAIAGGDPVCVRYWPPWPDWSEETVEAVREVLASGLWAISGRSTGAEPMDRRFARAFAPYAGRRHCVPTDHGTSALVIALEALDVGPGDEVVVPVLTWVACATAVLTVGATPVFADVDPGTLCITAAELEAAATERTRAAIVVHLHSTLADMEAICAAADRLGIQVVEDCAQAHGALFASGRRAGSFGALGVFSMQHGKVLTAGEGGAVVCDDEELSGKLEQLRADGRVVRADPLRGEMHLAEVGTVMGTNYSLSELQAAVLLERLGHLDEQNERRARSAAVLDGLLADPGLRPVEVPGYVGRRTVYEYAVERAPEAFAGRPTAVVAAALSAELGFPVYLGEPPLRQSPLYNPAAKARFAAAGAPPGPFPNAERAHRNLLVFHHSVLLAGADAMDDIAAAFRKVERHAAELPA